MSQALNDLSDAVVMSGHKVTDLNLVSSIRVRETGGPCGVVVGGIDLQAPLSGDEIYSLVTLFNHAGVMIVTDQHRLTPERQCEITEYFGRRFAPR